MTAHNSKQPLARSTSRSHSVCACAQFICRGQRVVQCKGKCSIFLFMIHETDGKYLTRLTISLHNHLKVLKINRKRKQQGRFHLFSKNYNGYISRKFFTKFNFGFVSNNWERNMCLWKKQICYMFPILQISCWEYKTEETECADCSGGK
jgi:hypothetical protein